MSTLYLKKMGCNFDYDEELRQLSDVGNYRVRTLGECIPGKDGRTYFLEFNHWRHYIYRRTNKRTGAPLKTPVKELVNYNGLFLETEYTELRPATDRQAGATAPLEREIHARNYDYTIEGILKAANDISTEHYDRVEFIN